SNYASGLDGTISRLSSLSNSSTTLEGYTYLGLGTLLERTHPQPGVNLTYIGTGTGDAGDQYLGLDRFGRVVDQRWKNGSGTDLDRYQYGYDRNDNLLFKKNLVDGTLSELYHANGASSGYDPLNQVSEFRRGTLSDANSDGVPDTVTTASRSQVFDPDAWGSFDAVNTDGTNTTRTNNKQN